MFLSFFYLRNSMLSSLLRALLLFSLLFFLSQPDAGAQGRKKKKKKEVVISPYDVDTLKAKIPRQRELFHHYVDEQQGKADWFDGTKDGQVHYGDDSLYTRLLTSALLRDVDQVQVMIENLPPAGDAQTDNQTKIRYLNAAKNLVRRFNSDIRPEPYNVRREVTNLKNLIIARHEKRTAPFVQENINRFTLANVELLEGFGEELNVLYKGMAVEEPKMMIRKLGDFAFAPYACDVVREAAKVAPNEVFNFASSTAPKLRDAVRRCDDPLVKSIVKIADQSKNALRAMPFLSDIHSGRRTIAEVDKITGDQDLYYKALVGLKLQGEAVGGDTYTDELAYRGMKYVREMNDLHDEPDAVRFKCIDGMAPEELYFIMVYGSDEIYTSSFTGAFKRMMERMGKTPGDSLLEKVRYDKFRTFIRMTAGYNRLDTFLTTIQEDKKNALMRDFIANLERGKDDDLFDAVDVADAFGSIDDEALTKFLRDEVRSNYERVSKAENKKGIIVYGLLATLFKGFTEGRVEGDDVGLPPVDRVPYRNLTSDSGVVYEQVFFYGDEDGKMSLSSFLGAINKDKGWKMTSDKYWMKFTSTVGKPVEIYANQPLMEPEGADEEAQKKLAEFMASQNIHPTVIVHRGHSYHLPVTLDRLQKQTKVVMLGSCGGYHNLGTVLDRSPDAQIISTKQTGTAFVNEKIIEAINKRLREGEDIEWVGMWKELEGYFATQGAPGKMFKDYVPPHKNLGAIFIKAYRRMSAGDAEDEA